MEDITFGELLPIDKRINKVIIKLFEEYFCIQDNEKVLILTEYPSAKDLQFKPIHILESILKRNLLMKYLVGFFQEQFPENDIELVPYLCQWVRYVRFNDEIRNKISQADIVFGTSEFSSLWFELNLLSVKKYNLRAASAPNITMETFLPGGAIDVDVEKMEKEVMETYIKLKKARVIKVFNNLGTELEITGDKSFYFETGKIDYAGKISNIPAGEITIVSDHINGTYVSPPGWIENIHSRVELSIENSTIQQVITEHETAKKIYYGLNGKPPFISHRITLGMNPNARNPFSSIELEKMRGVANLVIRPKGNYFNPFEVNIFNGHFPAPKITIEADNEVIMKDGRLNI